MVSKLMKQDKGARSTPETVSLTKKIKEAVDAGAESMTLEY